MKKDSKRIQFRVKSKYRQILEELKKDKRSMTVHIEEALEDRYKKIYGEKNFHEKFGK